MNKAMSRFLSLFVPGAVRRNRVRYWLRNQGRIRITCDIPNVRQYLVDGLRMPHPIGIVISKKVCMGKRCVIYQNVTIGTKSRAVDRERCYPVLGDDVQVFAGAIIVGDVHIGDGAVIGANSVVTKDVPAGEVWVGAPATKMRPSLSS